MFPFFSEDLLKQCVSHEHKHLCQYTESESTCVSDSFVAPLRCGSKFAKLENFNKTYSPSGTTAPYIFLLCESNMKNVFLYGTTAHCNTATLLKKRLHHVFSSGFSEIHKNRFFIEHVQWLLAFAAFARHSFFLFRM